MDVTFPAVVDNTIMKDFRRCPQYCFNKHIMGYSEKKALSVDLHFGSSFDKAIEAGRRAFFEQGQSRSDAENHSRNVAAQYWGSVTDLWYPTYSSKSFGSLVACLTHYWDAYPLGEDGLTPVEGGIQLSDSFELGVLHPVTGNPLRYAVNIDMLARDENGSIVVVDEKTAGKFSDSWWESWNMDTQMSGYLRYAKVFEAGGEVPRAQIRGICPGTSKTPPSHQEVPVFRSAYELGEWELMVERDLQHMRKMWSKAQAVEGAWHKAFGDSCVRYGRACEYTQACRSPDGEELLKANFNISKWNPLTRENQ